MLTQLTGHEGTETRECGHAAAEQHISCSCGGRVAFRPESEIGACIAFVAPSCLYCLTGASLVISMQEISTSGCKWQADSSENECQTLENQTNTVAYVARYDCASFAGQ